MSDKTLKNFTFHVPVELVKGQDNDETFKVAGIASTGSVDQQGETVSQGGIDVTQLSTINWDHKSDPASILGSVTKSKIVTHDGKEALYVEGELFKHHPQAKAVYGILKSLKPEQKGFIGWSIEGSILKRDSINKSDILKCKLKAVALTNKPVNQDTYATISKSMTEMQSQLDEGTLEVDATLNEQILEKVVNLEKTIEKMMSAGAGYGKAPTGRVDGEAMSSESMDKKKKKMMAKKKKMKKMCKKAMELYPDQDIKTIVNKVSAIYDKLSKTEKI